MLHSQLMINALHVSSIFYIVFFVHFIHNSLTTQHCTIYIYLSIRNVLLSTILSYSFSSPPLILLSLLSFLFFYRREKEGEKETRGEFGKQNPEEFNFPPSLPPLIHGCSSSIRRDLIGV